MGENDNLSRGCAMRLHEHAVKRHRGSGQHICGHVFCSLDAVHGREALVKGACAGPRRSECHDVDRDVGPLGCDFVCEQSGQRGTQRMPGDEQSDVIQVVHCRSFLGEDLALEGLDLAVHVAHQRCHRGVLPGALSGLPIVTCRLLLRVAGIFILDVHQLGQESTVGAGCCALRRWRAQGGMGLPIS